MPSSSATASPASPSGPGGLSSSVIFWSTSGKSDAAVASTSGPKPLNCGSSVIGSTPSGVTTSETPAGDTPKLTLMWFHPDGSGISSVTVPPTATERSVAMSTERPAVRRSSGPTVASTASSIASSPSAETSTPPGSGSPCAESRPSASATACSSSWIALPEGWLSTAPGSAKSRSSERTLPPEPSSALSAPVRTDDTTTRATTGTTVSRNTSGGGGGTSTTGASDGGAPSVSR